MPADQLNHFFAPMVRKVSGELGLGEREVVEYVSDVLTRFARSDHLYRLRSLEGKSLNSVVEIFAYSAAPVGHRAG